MPTIEETVADTDDARQLLTQPTDGWPYLEAHVCEVAA